MKEKLDGGPAFPVSSHGLNLDGMTLRDYFAAKAISSMFEFDSIDGKKVTFNDIAKMSYELADAMLNEREK